jgi:nitroreductase
VETWEAITTRRQVREYTADPVPEGHLARVVEAGARAPSARNWQRWDFVVVTDPDRRQRLSHVWRGATWTADAPCVIALVVPAASDPGEREGIRFDLGQVAMSMMLAATDVGLASGQAGCHDQGLARNVLGLPDDRECAILIALGAPATGPLRPNVLLDRRPLSEVAHFETYQSDPLA